MENDGTNLNSSGTPPPSNSPTQVYPITPFITLPQNNSSAPASSSQSQVPSKTSSTSQKKLLSSESVTTESVATGSTPESPHPPGIVPHADNATTPAHHPDSTPLSPQVSPSTIRATRSQTDELPPTAPVMVDAVPAHSSKSPAITENQAPPSRGALIAFGVLTCFFTILIILLLLWRKRRNVNLARKEAMAMMEEGQPSPTTKSEGMWEKSSGSPGQLSIDSFRKGTPAQEKDDDGVFVGAVAEPFAGSRTILRPMRPPSLHLDPKINHQELNQKTNESEIRRLKDERPHSWRSSIADVWATLGLPARVLQASTTTSTPPTDCDETSSSHSSHERSARKNLSKICTNNTQSSVLTVHRINLHHTSPCDTLTSSGALVSSHPTTTDKSLSTRSSNPSFNDFNGNGHHHHHQYPPSSQSTSPSSSSSSSARCDKAEGSFLTKGTEDQLVSLGTSPPTSIFEKSSSQDSHTTISHGNNTIPNSPEIDHDDNMECCIPSNIESSSLTVTNTVHTQIHHVIAI